MRIFMTEVHLQGQTGIGARVSRQHGPRQAGPPQTAGRCLNLHSLVVMDRQTPLPPNQSLGQFYQFPEVL